MSVPKLLVVDDDPGVRTQLKWGLDEYNVIMADSRETALQQFKAHQPPLVTLDLGLPPDIDGTTEGYAILKQILEIKPDTRIVVVSGSGEVENAPIACENGAYKYLPKPIAIDRLQVVIASAYEDYLSSISAG